jgi:APA family basic amino acid/polyamine antiporter
LELPRSLGLGSAVAVLVGSTIGSGIFRVPSSVAVDAGTLGGVAVVWLAGAVVALFGAIALIFAACAATFLHLSGAGVRVLAAVLALLFTDGNLPRALIAGTAIVVAVYVLMNLACLRVLPLSDVAASELLAVDTATRIFGPPSAAAIAGLVVLGTFGSLNGAMAADGLFFRPIAAVHPRSCGRP